MKKLHVGLLILLVLSFGTAFGSGTVEGGAAAKDEGLSPPGTWPVSQVQQTFTILVPAFSEDVENNLATLHLEKVTNVKPVYQVAAENFAQQVNLVLASGDYPDVILGANNNADAIPNDYVVKYGSAGVFIPLNDLIDKHAPNVQKMFGTEPWIKKVMTTPDGKIYGLPIINDDYHGKFGDKMYLNQAFLDNLGLERPKTTEELYQVLKAFKERDPNGNGKRDEIPLSGARTGWGLQFPGYLANSFMYLSPTTGSMYLKNGKVEFGFRDLGYRDTLAYCNRLWANGLADPASFTQSSRDLTAVIEDPAAMRVGASLGNVWNHFVQNGGPSGRFKLYRAMPPVTGPNGFRTVQLNKYKIELNKFLITSASDNPAVAMKWADYFFTSEGAYNMEYGPEGVGWRRGEPGEKSLNGQQAKFERFVAAGSKPNTNWGWRSFPRYQPMAERLGELTAADMFEPAKIMTRLTWLTINHYDIGISPPDDAQMPPVYMSPEDAKASATIAQDLNGYISEQTAAFITGRVDVNTQWNAYLAELKKIGLDKYLAIQRKAYDSSYK